MNGNPWTLPALVIGGVFALAIIAITVYAIVTERGDVARHRHSPRHSHRAAPFADPADHADPDGTGYVGQLLDARQLAAADHDDQAGDWWDQAPPPPPAPAWEATAPCPECHHCICGCDPHIDTTGVQPHAVLTWGATPAQITDQLAQEYLT